MKPGRRWVVLDADYFSNDFTDKLADRFGWAGVATWIALICAAKKHYPAGELWFSSEAEALHLMCISGWPLVDNDGQPWTLDEFFEFTGRRHMTSNRRRQMSGRRREMSLRRWNEWQSAAKRMQDAAYKRKSRAKIEPDLTLTESETQSDRVPSERERDRDRESTSRTSARKTDPERPPADTGPPKSNGYLKDEKAKDDIPPLKAKLEEMTANGTLVADTRRGDALRKRRPAG